MAKYSLLSSDYNAINAVRLRLLHELQFLLLQRLLASDKAKSKEILQEIQFLKRLSGHPNIVQFISAASISAAESNHGRDEFLVCTEYCEGKIFTSSEKVNQPKVPYLAFTIALDPSTFFQPWYKLIIPSKRLCSSPILKSFVLKNVRSFDFEKNRKKKTL